MTIGKSNSVGSKLVTKIDHGETFNIFQLTFDAGKERHDILCTPSEIGAGKKAYIAWSQWEGRKEPAIGTGKINSDGMMIAVPVVSTDEYLKVRFTASVIERIRKRTAKHIGTCDPVKVNCVELIKTKIKLLRIKIKSIFK